MATKIYKRFPLWVLPKEILRIKKIAQKQRVSVSELLRRMIKKIK